MCRVKYLYLTLYLQVLEQGRLVEFDMPYLLLNRRDGFLSKMVHQLGTSEEERLKEDARKSYELKTDSVIQENTFKESKISFYLPHEDLKTVEDSEQVTLETFDTRL